MGNIDPERLRGQGRGRVAEVEIIRGDDLHRSVRRRRLQGRLVRCVTRQLVNVWSGRLLYNVYGR